MFDKLGQLASFMKAVPKIREETEKLQQRIAQMQVEADAGAGMVRVRVNGRMEITAVSISNDALADKEVLEDLVMAAANQALEKLRRQIADENAKVAVSLGLPPGMPLPPLPPAPPGSGLP
jgi:DNA-binding YbaB/EbfC family protein